MTSSPTFTLEEVNSTRKKFRISVAPSVVIDAFGTALSEIQRTAEVKGFRKGKVPPSLVRKFFYKDVAQKAFDRVVEDSYQDVLKNVEFQIVSYPMIEPVGQFDESKEFVFTATVDVNPQLDIKDYSGLELKLPHAAQTDVEAETAKLVERIVRDNGRLVPEKSGRGVQKNDFVRLDYSVLENGKALKDRTQKDARIELNGSNLPDIENGLLGMKVGESKTFPVVFPGNNPDAALAGKSSDFAVTLKAIETLEIPELNDELAKRLGAETVEALKTNLQNSVTQFAEETKLTSLREQIFDKLLEKNAFDVPESLVDGTVDRAILEENGRREKKAQLNKDDEAVRKRYADWALKEVKGVLALGHVARQENITVNDEEVSSEIITFASQNRMDPRQLLSQGGKQMIEEFRGRVLIRKVLKHIVSVAKVENEPKPAEAPAS